MDGNAKTLLNYLKTRYSEAIKRDVTLRILNTVEDPEDRSLMNICFVMTEQYKELEPSFSEFAANRGMIGIKGHRDVGGFRASTYNALPKDSVVALVETMQEFERIN